MRFARALVQESVNGRRSAEFESIERAALARGLVCDRFTMKHLLRGRVPLDRDALVAGDIPTMHTAMRQLGVQAPAPDDYPEILRPWLHRRVWRSTLGEAVGRAASGEALFVKPAGALKRFAGFVLAPGGGLMVGASRRTQVWCSEVVSWRSEFRVFVVGGEVIGKRPYRAGEEPDGDVILAAVEALGLDRAAYAIDFGVLEDGTTALVERNDGYGIGSYGLDDGAYLDVLVTRWAQLLDGG
ncbi:MAG: ATP-grasp domain-containing protein [Alphaproteobacteria bacterium]|nr:ATP-grasp domain-containing protein [Alphaproteobacteria bacterium]MCB9695906.1 ATP-grasp domain-containing protein [Alphaproteobacteria bacterium]